MLFHQQSIASDRMASSRSALRTLLAVAGTAGLLIAATASAAGMKGKGMSEADAQYQREKAVCTSGQSNQDKATCLREANAAYQQARKGNLDISQQTPYEKNALERCKALPVSDQADCRHRVENPTAVEGSAASGGILRKDVTIVPAGS